MVQVVPASDLFTEEASPYGDHLCGYARLRPWTADPATGYAIVAAQGNLHSGYFATQVAAAFTAGTTDAFVSAVLRDYYGTDCTVKAGFRIVKTTGTLDSDSFRYWAVLARVSGGSIVDTVDSEHLLGVDAYLFMLNNTGALGPKWQLLRVNAGAITKLAEVVATVDVVNGLIFTQEMRLDVSDSGGTVQLTGRFNGTLVIQHADGAASRITAAGRAGIGACRERTVTTSGTTRFANVCPYFEVLEGGVTVVRDEWMRTNLNWARAITENNGFNGRSLMATWSSEVHGWSGSSQPSPRDPGMNRIRDTLQNANIRLWPAGNAFTQGRSATFNVDWALGNRTSGIYLRGTFQSPGTNQANGYRFRVVQNSSGTKEAYLERLEDGTGSGAVLARSVPLTAFTLASTTDFDLTFTVENIGGTGESNGTPRLGCYIDGTLVQFDEVFSAEGALRTSSGLILDQSSKRVLGGLIEGLEFGAHPASGTYVDTWVEATPTDTGIDPDDEDSVPVSAECDGKTGTFTIPYDWPVETRRTLRAAALTYENKSVQRVLLSPRERRVWTIHAQAATTAEKADLRTFWDDHDGMEIPFDFADPESPSGELVCAHFMTDALRDVLVNPGVNSFSFEIEELLD